MAATVYSFDPNTGAYAGTTIADEDQLDPGNLLLPAFTTSEEPPEVPDGHGLFWRGDHWEALRVDAPVPPPEEAETDGARFVRAQGLAQAQLDSVARSMGYDSILTAVTYAEEASVPKFQIEGKRLRQWRSLVWQECYTILAEVHAGATMPDENAFLARLPTYDEIVIMEQEGGS